MKIYVVLSHSSCGTETSVNSIWFTKEKAENHLNYVATGTALIDGKKYYIGASIEEWETADEPPIFPSA